MFAETIAALGSDPAQVRQAVFGALLVLSLALGIGLKRLVWRRLERRAAGSSSPWTARIASRINAPVNLLIFVAALTVGRQIAPPVIRHHQGLTLGLKIAVIVAAIWITDRLVALVLKSQALPSEIGASSRVLLLTLTRLLFLALGSLIVLDTLGISVTPILASLGVGSVAVALALQDTLSNFFSGIYLLVDKPVRIGDFVRLEDGLEGRIHHIGWRSTSLEYQGSSRVVIPNSKLSGARITNWSMPVPQVTVPVAFGLPLDADLSRVESWVADAARAAGAPDAQARFSEIRDASVQVSVSLTASDFGVQSELKHAFIKALLTRFKSEGQKVGAVYALPTLSDRG